LNHFSLLGWLYPITHDSSMLAHSNYDLRIVLKKGGGKHSACLRAPKRLIRHCRRVERYLRTPAIGYGPCPVVATGWNSAFATHCDSQRNTVIVRVDTAIIFSPATLSGSIFPNSNRSCRVRTIYLYARARACVWLYVYKSIIDVTKPSRGDDDDGIHRSLLPIYAVRNDGKNTTRKPGDTFHAGVDTTLIEFVRCVYVCVCSFCETHDGHWTHTHTHTHTHIYINTYL
jgi:hypothetical protein